MSLRPRHFLLPVAAVVITGLCVWKITRDDAPRTVGASEILVARAPVFVERNHDLWPVKLGAFLGRHRILLAFFDDEVGADRSPLLLRLRKEHADLSRRGWIVIAIGDAGPIANRAAIKRAGGFPFEILSDIEDRSSPDWDTLGAYGRFDAESGRVQPGLVVIDRSGNIRWRDGVPDVEEDADATIDAILAE